MEINEIKDSLAEEGYCIFEGLLDSQEAERLDGIARSIMESMGSAYISLEGSLNEIPELAPLVFTIEYIISDLPYIEEPE